MIKCKRCGKCCHYVNDKGELKRCVNLIKFGRLFHCRIYKRRLGFVIYVKGNGEVVRCHERELVPLNYDGCPYNQ